MQNLFNIPTSARCLCVNDSPRSRDVEKDLRTKCKRLNDYNKPLAIGKQLYVVANGRLHSQDADGHINHKKSLDVDRLNSEIDASKGSDYFYIVVFSTHKSLPIELLGVLFINV